MSDLACILRLLLITALSGLIGYERERVGRAAGLRTHILVGVGSCLIMMTDLHLVEVFAGRTSVDPARMAAQVVSGIGFLGAGTILQFRASVRGLTTAASLWAVAGLGLAVGAGFHVGAVSATAILLMVLFGLRGLEHRIRKDWYRVLLVETRASKDDLAQIRRILAACRAQIQHMEITRGDGRDLSLVEVNVKLTDEAHEDAVLSEVAQLAGTHRAHWA